VPAQDARPQSKIAAISRIGRMAFSLPMRTRAGGASFHVFKHAAHAAARVGHVALAARDQVHVDVHARLAGGFADVDADVVAIRRMRRADELVGPIEELEDRRLFSELLS
jgi:hypothetical protein